MKIFSRHLTTSEIQAKCLCGMPLALEAPLRMHSAKSSTSPLMKF